MSYSNRLLERIEGGPDGFDPVEIETEISEGDTVWCPDFGFVGVLKGSNDEGTVSVQKRIDTHSFSLSLPVLVSSGCKYRKEDKEKKRNKKANGIIAPVPFSISTGPLGSQMKIPDFGAGTTLGQATGASSNVSLPMFEKPLP